MKFRLAQSCLLVSILFGFVLWLAQTHRVSGADARGGPRIAPGPVMVTVKATDGKPAVRAVVRIGGRQAVTDGGGVVWFDGLPAGPAKLLIEQPGYDRLEKAMDFPAGKREPVEIVVSPTVVVNLEGVVTLQGHGGALAGAKVVLTPAQVAAVRQGVIQFRTDWDGKFQAMDVPVGAYKAEVSAVGAITKTFDLAVKTPMPAIAWQLVAETRPAAMSVSVVDVGSGAAVGGAKVTLAEAGTRGVLGEATADAGGRVAFKDLKLARLNWEDAKGKLAAGRRNVTVLAEAKGYEKTIVNAQLDDNSTATVRMNSTAVIEERKPNNVLAQAQTILTGATVSFKIAKNDDRSFFKFHVGYPSTVTIEIAAGGDIETYLRVYNAEGKQFTQSGAAPGVANVLYLGGLPIGDYFVSVEEWNMDNFGTKPMKLRVVTEPAPDSFEPNNTLQTARLIRTGEEVRGCILPRGDIDWYRFEMPRTGQVRITMPPIAYERYVNLCDESGKVITGVGANTNAPLGLVAQLGKGRYSINLTEWNSDNESTLPYAMRLEAIEDDGIDDPPITAGPMRAVRTVELGKLAGSSIWPVGDMAVYAVSLPSAGRFHLDFKSFIEVYAYIRGADGKVLAQGGTAPRTPGRLTVEVGKPSTLYLEIHEWNNDNASPWPYQISTMFEPCDEMELAGRNDTWQTASPIELNGPVRGSIMPTGDLDWYRLEVDHPGWLTVSGTGPTELYLYIRDSKQRVLAQGGGAPVTGLTLSTQVIPGTYYIETHEWNDDNASSTPYLLTATLRRAEPQERVPLANDPPRLLKLGEAQAFWIDHFGDRDTFTFTIPQAGKFNVRLRSPIEQYVRIYEEPAGGLIYQQGFSPNADVKIDLETKGPSRYRMMLEEWNNDNIHRDFPGFVKVDTADRPIPCDWITAAADPYQPTKVTFTRKAVPNFPGGTRMSVDPNGESKTLVDVTSGTGTFTYPSEGNFKAVAIVEGAGGVTTRVPFWVEATGPRERKGIYIVVDHPFEGEMIEADRPVTARAISYSGKKVESMSLEIDGKSFGTQRNSPFEFDVHWPQVGPGKHECRFSVRDAGGESATLSRSVNVSEYFDLQPADGATVTGNAVKVSWQGAAFGAARVRYRQQGTTDWKEAAGESGRRRSVALDALEPGKVYEIQPIGGKEAGPVRTATRIKGLAFGKAKYAANIKRDYDQRLGISVRNHGDKPMTVRLECGKPAVEEKLLVGFVGEGSEGAPLNLQPGEERDFLLAASAQDVLTEKHKFPIRLASVSGEGFTDEADVELNVKLPEVKLDWQEVGPNPNGLGKIMRLTNKGDTLTDLDLSSSSPDMFVSPGVNHGLFPAGATMDVVATPRLYEDFKSAKAQLSAGAVGKKVEKAVEVALPDGKQIFGVQLTPGHDPTAKNPSMEETILAARALAGAYLNPKTVDWSKKTNPQDTDGDGKPDRWTVFDEKENILWVGDDTDGDGEIDFVHADIGNDGQYDYSAFKTKDGWEPTNLVEAYLEMGFSLGMPRNLYEKHDLDIIMNGKVIGSLRDAIPEGNYTFKLPPSVIRFNADGTPEAGDIEIQSKHMRGGHYAVGSDFRLKARMTGTRAWVVSDSRDNAEKAARKLDGLNMEGPDYSVSSNELQVEGPMTKGSEVVITAMLRNVGATRTHSVTLALMRSAPGGAPIELMRQTIENVPLSGGTSVRLPWKAAAGNHALRVVVDPDKTSGDTNRDNNEAIINVSIAGEDAKPTLKFIEPLNAASLKDTITPVTLEATDDSGIARAELKIDGGLYNPMKAADANRFTGKFLLQPGEHTLTARVTDTGGNQVEQAIKVTVAAPVAAIKIVEPAAGAAIDTRQLKVKLTTDETATTAMVRVNGGAWVRVVPQGGQATAEVELNFGNCNIEAMAINARGARQTATVAVNCTAQKTQEDEATKPKKPDTPEKPNDDSNVAIDKEGDIDVNTPNGPVRDPADKNATGGQTGAGKTGQDPADPKGNTPATTPGGGNKPPAGDDGSTAGGGHKPKGFTPLDIPPGSSDFPAAFGDPALPGAGTEAESDPMPGSATATEAQPENLPPPLKDAPQAGNKPNDQPVLPELPVSAGPVRPAGGFIGAQVKHSDWYCTNRPNIKAKFKLPDWLKRKNLTYADKKEYDAMVKKFLDDMRRRGIDTTQLEKFQNLLRNRLRGINQPGELPGFLESLGMEAPPKDDPVALKAWRDRMESAADAWYLRLLASGDPKLVADGLKARSEAIGQFDKAMQEAANAACETIHANQKLVEDVADTLPLVGDVLNIYAAATGELALSGDQISAMERVLRGAFVLGPLGLEQLFKRSATAQEVLKGIGEMAESMGKSGREMLANALGKHPDDVEKWLNSVVNSLTKERSVFGELEDRAQRAAKEFAKTPEGIADFNRMLKDHAEARDLVKRIENAAPNSAEFRQAIQDLQANKTAQRLVNEARVSDSVREQVNKEISRWYDVADKGVAGRLDDVVKGAKTPAQLADAADELGCSVKELQDLRDRVNKIAKERGIDPADVVIDKMTVTNARPPKQGGPQVSVGRDRDVTFVVRTKDGEILTDINHNISKRPYEEEFWKAQGRDTLPMKNGKIDHDAITYHADRMDQTVTSKAHLEAYNTGEAQLKDFLDKSKQPTLTRIEDLKDTVTFKSDHWFEKAAAASKAGDPIMAAKNTAEGMRQATKQYDDLIVSRVKQYGLNPATSVPPRLQASMDIFRMVKEAKISPAKAEAMLNSIGTGSKQAVKDMATFLEGLEKTTGVGWRKIQSSMLVTNLSKVPNKGAAEWANTSLGAINDALAHGHVSGTQFTKLRQEVLAATAAKQGKPVAAWADDAVGKGLISREEWALLKKK